MRKTTVLKLLIAFSLMLIFPLARHACIAAESDPAADLPALKAALQPLIGKQDAVLVLDPDGRSVVRLNADTPLIPASIQKILSSLAALHYLGADYRFPTDFFISPQGNLTIRGYGDPLLVSERLQSIAATLSPELPMIRDLVLDDSFFDQPIVIPGSGRSLEPYDAPNGALCVNFNTVHFKREKGKWISAEPQTPILPSIIPRIQGSGMSQGRILLAADTMEGLRYAGELFGYFFKEAGVSMTGSIREGKVNPEHDRLLLRYESPDRLTDVIAALLAYSNNFIANQLLLTMGAHREGPPATMEKGLKCLRDFYHKELGVEEGHLAEASGISRRNRLSAQHMMIVLQRFKPYHQLLRHDGRQWYKTGTLNGIRTRAGYLDAAGGGHYLFVVMLNSPGKTTDRIMSRLLKHLK